MTPQTNSPRSDALVFFGATGDLAFKQIFPALQALVKHDRLTMPVVAVGRRDLPIVKLRARVKESLAASEDGVDEGAFEKLAGQLRYASVDFDAPKSFRSICDAIPGATHPLHYVALPPDIFERVAVNLAAVGLARGARLALEKPFGHDLTSAKALSEALHPSFQEESLFRIDHFLGKEAVENLVYFRAANPLIDRSLNSDQVESVQITMAETFGVKGRATFYDGVGAVRDVVQNHMLETIACLAMDLPTETGHGGLREARSRLLAQMRTLAHGDIVRGQARGYKDEEGVAKDSTTETFAILRFMIDSPRWKGVPFFVRVGKSLAITATEVVVRWKGTEVSVLDERRAPAPNQLRFRIGPDTAIALGANVKAGGEGMVGEARELVLHRDKGEGMMAYERLLGDAIDGDATLFARRDAVEESWRVVDPVLDDATPIYPYVAGSWGPVEGARIVPRGGWVDPG
jgi:glucose-6-phosphate 1-dehydrogenase